MNVVRRNRALDGRETVADFGGIISRTASWCEARRLEVGGW